MEEKDLLNKLDHINFEDFEALEIHVLIEYIRDSNLSSACLLESRKIIMDKIRAFKEIELKHYMEACAEVAKEKNVPFINIPIHWQNYLDDKYRYIELNYCGIIDLKLNGFSNSQISKQEEELTVLKTSLLQHDKKMKTNYYDLNDILENVNVVERYINENKEVGREVDTSIYAQLKGLQYIKEDIAKHNPIDNIVSKKKSPSLKQLAIFAFYIRVQSDDAWKGLCQKFGIEPSRKGKEYYNYFSSTKKITEWVGGDRVGKSRLKDLYFVRDLLIDFKMSTDTIDSNIKDVQEQIIE